MSFFAKPSMNRLTSLFEKERFMITTILCIVIVGIIGILIGMILESVIENFKVENDPEEKVIEVIEINDKTEKDPEDYFKPF